MCRGCHPAKRAPIKLSGPGNPEIANNSKKANAWLKRSMAQRTVRSVEVEVDIAIGKSPFLNFLNEEEEENIASLDRTEIEVGELLGRGAFSEVYNVTGIQLNTSYQAEEEKDECLRERLCHSCQQDENARFVIKHLRSDLMLQRSKFNNAAADLVLESKFLQKFDHPNIIKIRGWATKGVESFGGGSHDGYFVILDHLDETLAHRVGRWRSKPDLAPSMAERLNYASQITSALSYMHSHNIMYRDLKPDNIGFKQNTIQLFDMGLCREVPETGSNDDSVFEMSGVGTLRYCAPEIILGTGYNLKADVYSFSILLHEMLSLAKPFDLYNHDMYHLLVCEEGERPRLDGAWPQDLRDLLRAMWAKEPSDRPSIQHAYDEIDRVSTRIQQTTRKVFGGISLLPSSLKLSQFIRRAASGSFCDGTSKTVAISSLTNNYFKLEMS